MLSVTMSNQQASQYYSDDILGPTPYARYPLVPFLSLAACNHAAPKVLLKTSPSHTITALQVLLKTSPFLHDDIRSRIIWLPLNVTCYS